MIKGLSVFRVLKMGILAFRGRGHLAYVVLPAARVTVGIYLAKDDV